MLSAYLTDEQRFFVLVRAEVWGILTEEKIAELLGAHCGHGDHVADEFNRDDPPRRFRSSLNHPLHGRGARFARIRCGGDS